MDLTQAVSKKANAPGLEVAGPEAKLSSASQSEKLKKLLEDNRRRRMRIKIKDYEVQKIIEQEKQQIQHMQEKRRQYIEEQKQKRRQEAEDRIRLKKEQRLQSIEQMHENTKKLSQLGHEPLYKKIESKFSQQDQKYQHDRIQKVKEEKKVLYQPIRLTELSRFSSQCNLIVKELNVRRQEERQLKKVQSQEQFDAEPLKSRFYKDLLERKKRLKEEEIEKKKEQERLYKVKQCYQQYVKHAHLPKVDASKVDELKDRVSKLKHPVKQRQVITPGMSLREIETMQSRQSGEDPIQSTLPQSRSKLPSVLASHQSSTSKLPPLIPKPNQAKDTPYHSATEQTSELPKGLRSSESAAALRRQQVSNFPLKNILQKGRLQHTTLSNPRKFSSLGKNRDDNLKHLDRIDQNFKSQKDQSNDFLKQQREKRERRNKERTKNSMALPPAPGLLEDNGKAGNSTLIDYSRTPEQIKPKLYQDHQRQPADGQSET